MSIVHFSAFGGPHNRTAQVAIALQRHGVETIIVIPDEPGSAYTRLTAFGLEVHRLPIQRLRRTTSLRTQLRTVQQLKPGLDAIRTLIRDRNIDVVALNALNAPHLAIAPRAERSAIVWELIDTFPNTIVRHAFMPFVCRWSDVIMSTGRATAEFHPGAIRFGDRLVYFHPCVDMGKFTRDPDTTRLARHTLGIPEGVPVVGTVGNLNPMKGHATFVTAAARLRRIIPNVRFVVLGATYTQYPGYWDGVMALARNYGLQPNEDIIVRNPGSDVATLAQAFDVFWMTSQRRSEGIPTAIGEAMALEIPVVAGSVGSIGECVVTGRTGFAVAPCDPEAMVEPTVRLLRDSELRRRMGTAARQSAMGTFAAEIGARQHLHGYKLAVAHRGRKHHGRKG